MNSTHKGTKIKSLYIYKDRNIFI